MISYCTTCRNRLSHLQRTFDLNVAAMDDSDEWLILDYGSTDGLANWVKSQHVHKDVKLVTYDTPVSEFQMARAKNAAHYLASQDVVCNLDADNWLVDGFSHWLKSNLDTRQVLVGHPLSQGSRGRVALSKNDFFKLGGYNERLVNWGYDVGDMVSRAVKAAMDVIYIPVNMLRFVDHTDECRNLGPNKDRIDSDKANRYLSQNTTPVAINSYDLSVYPLHNP